MKGSHQVAIVTGASQGIGRAIARSFARDGIHLALTARNHEKLSALAQELVSEFSVEVTIIPLDISLPESPAMLTQATLERFGRFDILVCNAGGSATSATFETLTEKDWRDCFELNFFSAMNLARAALGKMESPGTIVHIGSLTSVEPGFFNPHYAAAKAALLNFSKSLSHVLAPRAITVNTICPGPIETESFGDNVTRIVAAKGDTTEAAIRAAEIGKVPLGRLGTPEDVAALTSFLCSPEARWITGSCFVIDGGKKRSVS